jgi:Methyltransferase domain
MAMLLETQLLLARGMRNVQRVLRPLGSMEAAFPKLAEGRSFVDVGAIWNVHGKIAFLAESSGASSVTAVDLSSPTDEYLAEHERRHSKVRFVQGDLHDEDVLAEIGPHDVVWCTGVLYHCPDPVHTVECLRQITGQTLVLGSSTVPPVAGSRNGAVFFPVLSDAERRAYDRAFAAVAGSGSDATRGGLTTPFDAEESYINWWWGFSPATMVSIVESTGFRVSEVKTSGFHTRVVAERS